jgi:hypothetical protein
MAQEIQGAGMLYNSAEAHTCTGTRGLGLTLPLSQMNLKEVTSSRISTRQFKNAINKMPIINQVVS